MAHASTAFVLWNEAFPRRTNLLQLQWSITAAKTVSPLPITASAVLTTFDAIASQTTIDNFLLTTNEFLIAAFDATAMGTDTFAGIIKMNGANLATTSLEVGQAQSVQAMVANLYSGTNGSTVVTSGVVSSTAMTASSNTSQIAVGANGDIAFRFVASGLDILTAGLISVNIFWTSK
jgi:hypothetical protein